MDFPCTTWCMKSRGLFVLSKGSFTGTHRVTSKKVKTETHPATASRSNSHLMMKIMGVYWKNWWKTRQDPTELRKLRDEKLPNISNGYIASITCHKNERHLETMVVAVIALIILSVVFVMNIVKSDEIHDKSLLSQANGTILFAWACSLFFFLINLKKYHNTRVSGYTLRVAHGWRDFFHDTLAVSGTDDKLQEWIGGLSESKYDELNKESATIITPEISELVRKTAYRLALLSMQKVIDAELRNDIRARVEADKIVSANISIIMMSTEVKYSSLRKQIYEEANT